MLYHVDVTVYNLLSRVISRLLFSILEIFIVIIYLTNIKRNCTIYFFEFNLFIYLFM